MEVFDALVVITSFALDIVYANKEGATSGLGLLIILRLWRVVRILNGKFACDLQENYSCHSLIIVSCHENNGVDKIAGFFQNEVWDLL